MVGLDYLRGFHDSVHHLSAGTCLCLLSCTLTHPCSALHTQLWQQGARGQLLPVLQCQAWAASSAHPTVPTAAPQLYNEEILDLFDSTRDPEARHRKSNIKIHEDASGSIYTTGVTSRLISSQDEVGAGGDTHRAGVAAGCHWPGMCYVGTAWWGEISPRMGVQSWGCSGKDQCVH